MAKWRITKETKDIFRWKAVTPDGRGAIWSVTFEVAIKTIYEIAACAHAEKEQGNE